MGVRLPSSVPWPISGTVNTSPSQGEEYGFNAHIGHQRNKLQCQRVVDDTMLANTYLPIFGRRSQKLQPIGALNILYRIPEDLIGDLWVSHTRIDYLAGILFKI